MEAAREVAEFEVMEECIRRRQKKFVQFIATQFLIDLCEKTERTPGHRWGCGGGSKRV